MYNEGDVGWVYNPLSSGAGVVAQKYKYSNGKWSLMAGQFKALNSSEEIVSKEASMSELQAQGEIGAGTINPSEIQNMSFDEAGNYIAEKKYHWKPGQSLTAGRDGKEGTSDDFPDAKWSIIQNQIRSFMPEKQGVDEKEREFARQDFKQDI